MIALSLQKVVGYGLSIPIAIAAGVAIGLLNGILVAKVKINSFIATIGTMTILQGATYTITERQLGEPLWRQGLRHQRLPLDATDPDAPSEGPDDDRLHRALPPLCEEQPSGDATSIWSGGQQDDRLARPVSTPTE